MIDHGQPNVERGPEVLSLAEAYAHGDLSDEMVERLDQLLLTDPEARRQYVDYLQDSYHLHSLAVYALASQEDDALEVTNELPKGTVPFLLIQKSGQSLPSGVWPSTVGFFSQGMPLAYLLAAVICGFGFLVGSLVHVSTPVQVVQQFAPLPSSSSTTNYPLPTTHSAVGRITGMVDCKWAEVGWVKRSAAPPAGGQGEKRSVATNLPSPASGRGAGGEGSLQFRSPVRLGDIFALSSGLLEITYDTGAKVILQGPVTYEVESKDSGYLSVGKLTARLEKKSNLPSTSGRGAGGEGGEKNEELPGSNSSFLIPHSYFAVKTPTAIVTDLGTEFGVEVSEEGNTTSHVFRGVVEVRQVAESGESGQPIRLNENESVRVEKQQGTEGLKIQRGVTDLARFVRSEQLAKLVYDGQAKHARKPRLRWPILDKTLVAWVSLANTEQHGVGVLSLVSAGIEPDFDSIAFGELERGKWMAASEGWARSQKDQSACHVETASPGELVQIAIVYDWTSITIYRNGEKYAQYETDKRQIYRDDSFLLIGKRHLWRLPRSEPKDGPSALPTLAGAIEEARFYNFAMPAEMIAKLKLNEPSPVGPVGQWTFEDGTARDVTGHFPIGELQGKARITDGRLILDGAESYLLIPAALQPSKQPPADAKASGESSRKPNKDFRIETSRKGGSGA